MKYGRTGRRRGLRSYKVKKNKKAITKNKNKKGGVRDGEW
jgi:hypothetical protein